MPRTFITAERTLLAGNYNVFTRVEVKDSDGTWRDLTAYTGGRNFFSSVTWTRQLDAPVMAGTITFLRSVLGASLAPTIVGSIMNTNAASAYVPLLAGGRAIRISTNCTAVGVAPAVGDWREMFLGRIDDPDWGGDEGTIAVTISDVGAWLLGKNIDTERQYGSAGGTPLETVIQNILTDNVSGPLGAVTLYTPTSPGWNLHVFTQQKVNVLTAIRTLAQQIGWDVRYVYDASNVYRLTLFQPQRTKTVADYTLTGAEYYALPEVSQNLGDVRTRIGGSYVDAATKVRLWRYVQSDLAHTNQYDVVYMEINEDATSNIDSATEMDKMLLAALHDLQDPAATVVAEDSFFWPAELGDLIGYPSNAVHFDTTQALAVVGIEHTLDPSGETSKLTCRGTVAGNRAEWLVIQTGGPDPAPVAPALILTSTAIEANSQLRTVHVDVSPGTTPRGGLTFSLTRKVGPNAPVLVTSGAGTTLPLDLVARLDPRFDTLYQLSVTDPLVVTPFVATLTVGADARDAQRGTGVAIARSGDDGRRGGDGGIPVQGAHINATPLYDAPGGTPLIDPVTKRIQAALAGPSGIGSDVFERGGGKGDAALSGANKLQTGVESTATAADGIAGIESSKGSSTKASRNAGTAGGRVAADNARSGMGGMPISGSRTETAPYMDAANSTILIDPILKQIGATLARPSDGAPIVTTLSQLRGTDGQLLASARLVEGSQTLKLVRGVQRIQARHNDTLVFSPPFASTPYLQYVLLNCLTYEPRTGQWTGAAYNATLPQGPSLDVPGVTGSGGVLSARLRQVGGTTQNNSDYAAGNSLVAVGAVNSAALAAAPSSSGHYTVRYKGSVTVTALIGRSVQYDVTVVVNRLAAGSSGSPTELSRITYSSSDPDGTGPYTTTIDETLDLTFSGMGTTDTLEVRVVSAIKTGTGSASFALHGVNPTDDTGAHGCYYFTGAADAYAPMTPDASHKILVIATGWQ